MLEPVRMLRLARLWQPTWRRPGDAQAPQCELAVLTVFTGLAVLAARAAREEVRSVPPKTPAQSRLSYSSPPQEPAGRPTRQTAALKQYSRRQVSTRLALNWLPGAPHPPPAVSTRQGAIPAWRQSLGRFSGQAVRGPSPARKARQQTTTRPHSDAAGIAHTPLASFRSASAA